MKNDSLKDQYRINERIKVREVRLVGDNVENGVFPIFQALKIAEDLELDLVEISPNAVPPVCTTALFRLLQAEHGFQYFALCGSIAFGGTEFVAKSQGLPE